jgi:hypothetical protein
VKADLLEPGVAKRERHPTRREYDEMPRGIQAKPIARVDTASERARVGRDELKDAAGLQQSQCGGQSPGRIVKVLDAVTHRDRVEPLATEEPGDLALENGEIRGLCRGDRSGVDVNSARIPAQLPEMRDGGARSRADIE